jgi:hypothetical protein
MGLLDRFRNKPVEPSVTRRVLDGPAGSLSAHQAWAVVAPVARELDSCPRLTLITSGLDLDHAGYSRTWEFIFFLPRRYATLMLSIEPDPGHGDLEKSPSILTQRLRPASSADALRPAFPGQFRDSPEVVAEFIAKGVDFVAGPSDMKLEGRILPSGDAVWVTYYWDQQFSTPFA